MKNKANDLTGQKFGRLTVLERDYSRKGKNSYWICQCDCGNITSVSRCNLRNGSVQSCGCLKRERVSKAKTIDLTGQKFCRLTVLKRDNLRIEKEAYWICQCQCGKIIEVRSSDLRTGHTRSCGCLKGSKGEDKIKDILFSLNIKFVQQKVFDNLKDKSNLRFDFFLPDYNCCIEYNGIQHYESVKYFGGEKKFKEIQFKDNIKKQWCQENNIKLIEIPYWDFDKIDKNYLEQLIKIKRAD